MKTKFLRAFLYFGVMCSWMVGLFSAQPVGRVFAKTESASDPAQAEAIGNWSALGQGLSDFGGDIVFIGKDMYVGGRFTSASSVADTSHIAKWNGSSWSSVGLGLSSGEVYGMAVSGTDLYAVGQFTDAGGDPNADYVAKWDGTSWSALGPVPFDAIVRSVVVVGTDVYVGGQFNDAHGDPAQDHIAKWDSSSWSAVGGGLDQEVTALATNGTDLYAAGQFRKTGNNVTLHRIGKWDGSNWSELGPGIPYYGYILTLAVSGTDLYASGSFIDVAGDPNADRIVKWDGSTWSALGAGLNTVVWDMTISGNTVYAAGKFTDAGGDPNADYVAKWNGSSWSALGNLPLGNSARAIAVKGSTIYAAGQFQNAGGDTDADYIAAFTDAITVSFTSDGALDGQVLESSENSKVGGSADSASVTISLGDTAARQQYRGILSFNTGAALPDNATIINAKLKVKKQSALGSGDPLVVLKGFGLDIANGFFNTSALTASDFQASAILGNGPFNPSLNNGWYSMSLSASGRSVINKYSSSDGLTQIRIRLNLDDNNDSLANVLKLYSGNAAMSNRPILEIAYTVP